MTCLVHSPQSLRRMTLGVSVLLCGLALAIPAQSQTRKAPAKPTAATRRAMTQSDVQKLWANKSDSLLSNELRLRGLAFTPSGYWIDVALPKATGVTISEMPSSTSALKRLIPPPPDLDEVARLAPDLLASLKAAAQKHSDADLQTLIDPSLMANKASVYDLFDSTNFRASSLGKPALDEHNDVGMPYFKLDNSNVEKLYYVLFSKPKGKLIVEDFLTGPEVADLYLHDQETLAKSKLQTMFRALNDGDQTGLKELCSPGLYEAIQAWGGDKHPGDRLTHSRSFDQVTTQTSVPLDQKSIRVVTKVTYPLKSGKILTVFIDFERIGNDLKVVRLRDDQNRVVAYDPNIDNYLNRRYALPDGPIPTEVAETEVLELLSLEKIRALAVRYIQYHDPAKLEEAANAIIEGSPLTGDGPGLLAAVDLMKRKSSDASRHGVAALDKNGAAYFLLSRHAINMTGGPQFSAATLIISKSKIDYYPAPGTGSQEVIDLASLKVSLEKGNILRPARPFLKMEFKGSDGKGKTYNFADYGTACPSDTTQKANDLVDQPGGGVCGVLPSTSRTSLPPSVPLKTPQAWREDLTAVIQVIEKAKALHK